MLEGMAQAFEVVSTAITTAHHGAHGMAKNKSFLQVILGGSDKPGHRVFNRKSIGRVHYPSPALRHLESGDC